MTRSSRSQYLTLSFRRQYLKKSRIWILVIASILIVAGAILYGQLNWYGRAKLVSIVFQEDWPLAWGAKRHVEQRRSDFDAVADIFRDDPGVKYIRFPFDSDTGFCIQRSQHGECEFQDDAETRSSIIATRLYPIFRTTQGHILFYAGPEIRGERRYDVAILRRTTKERTREQCSSVDRTADFGACFIPILGQWSVDYEWMPRFGSGTIIEEAQKLAEDVAEELVREKTD